jgi:hypothetical protein
MDANRPSKDPGNMIKGECCRVLAQGPTRPAVGLRWSMQNQGRCP